MHRVDADAVWGKGIRIQPHQPDHAVLGRLVSERSGPQPVEPSAEALEAGRRAGDDDRAALVLLEQHRLGGLDRVENPAEHDVDGVVPTSGLLTSLAEEGQDPGVRDDKVKAPKFGDTTLDGSVECVPIANVALDSDDSTSGALDQFHRLVEVVMR